MTAERETILGYALRTGFPMQKLFAAKTSKFSGPLAELILSSEEISKRASEPWAFKSLAQKGTEDFVQSARICSEDHWEISLMSELAFNVCRWVYYEEMEGLLFFVQDENGGYRVARKGDEDYDFARRLHAEGAISDLKFSVPPPWTERLFLGRENLKAYELLWYDLNEPEAYKESQRIKAKAVLRETGRRMGSIPGMSIEQNGDLICDEKLRANIERNRLSDNTLVATIAALLALWPGGKTPSGKDLEKAAALVGVSISDDSIRKALKAAKELAQGLPSA